MRAVVLDSPELDAYGQMALDEALLDFHPKDIAYLRFYRWPYGGINPSTKIHSPIAVTFGYFQGYEEVERQVRTDGFAITFPLVRRPTGGGVVYHDGDITFSLIFPWGRLETASWVYKNIHRGVHLGLKALGWGTSLWSPSPSLVPAVASARPQKKEDIGCPGISVCFTEPSPMDLIAGSGQKVLGGALRRRMGTGLYQGSMRTEVFNASRDRLLAAIVEGLGLEWKVLFERDELTDEVWRSSQRLRKERYATDEWNKKR